MRRIVLAIPFLLSAVADAQINLGEEIVSTPLRERLALVSIAAPAVAVAKDDQGVAVAWTMSNGAGADRIYVSRLNDVAQAEAAREIPLSSANPTLHEAYPSLAPWPGGSGFVLAWLEIDSAAPRFARAVFCRLDAALKPSAPAELLPAAQLSWPVLARTKGDATWLSAGGFVWKLSKDGTLGAPMVGIGASDMTVGTDVPQLVGSHPASAGFTCSCIPYPVNFPCPSGCQAPLPEITALDFTALFIYSSSTVFKFHSDAKPAISSNSSDVLVAWFSGTQINGGDVVVMRATPAQFASFAFDRPLSVGKLSADFGDTRPDVASDGNNYAVVWRVSSGPRNHDVAGAMVDKDGKVTPLSIATSPADERDPAVLALGNGTFLVVYEKVSGSERRIAERFVSFGGRRRAAR